MNSMSLLKYKNSKVPFYAWDCLTLKLKKRDINLVIRDQKNMERHLKFLIYSLNTIDGKKNSSLMIQHLSETKDLKRLKHQLMLKTMTKYKILALRCKISFLAFMKKQTITELILTQIISSHKKLVQEKSSPPKRQAAASEINSARLYS